jgi:DNA-binding transcriptional regulator YdaS (Cro superfamily)
MRAYRQWFNGVRRRAAVRSPLWRGIERALSGVLAQRLARIAAALATATALVATIGLVARLGDVRAEVERGLRASVAWPVNAPAAPSPAAPSAR